MKQRFQSKPSEKRLWAAALCLAAFLVCVSFLCCRLIYETNDDSSIVAAASGAVTGLPYAGNGFTSYMYGMLLSALFSVVPSIPWHAVILMGTIFLSLATLIKSLFSFCCKRRIPLVVGSMLFLAFYVGVLLPYVVMLQFTTVPSLAVTAACCLLLTSNAQDRTRALRFEMLIFSLLLFVSFILRIQSFWVSMPLLAAHSIMHLIEKRTDGKKLVFLSLGILFCFGLLTAFDQFLYHRSDSGWKAFEAFNTYLGGFLDYHNTEEAAKLAPVVTGWTPWMTYMVRNWYQLDARMTGESLKKLLTALDAASPQTTLWTALYAAGSLLLHYPIFGASFAGFVFLAFFSLIHFVRAKRWGAVLRVLGCGAYLIAFIAYFYGFLGRMPMRAAFTAACPCYAFLLFNCLEAFETPLSSIGQKNNLKRYGICTIVVILCAASPIIHGNRFAPWRWEYQHQDSARTLSEEIVEYVTREENQQYVFVTDVMLDFSPLYVYQDNLPDNLLSWCSGMYHSPLYQEKLHRLGYSSFSSENLFDADVLLLISSPTVLGNLSGYLKEDYAPHTIDTIMKNDSFGVYKLVTTPKD